MNKLVWVSAIALCAHSGLVFAQERFERTVSVTGAVDIDVVSDVGGVALTVGTGDVVRVRGILKPILGRVDFGRSDENIRALAANPPVEQTGNRIRIGFPQNPSWLDGVSMRLEIEVPSNTRVRARTTSGAIRLDRVAGPVDGQSTSGRIEVRDVAGETYARSTSGGITIDSIAGPVIAESTSGGIAVSDSKGAVRSRTTSGRIELQDIGGEVRATTNSGSIVIQRAAGAVTAHNRSGSIEAMEVGAALDATTGSGAVHLSQTRPAAIRASTRSGQIRVKLATDAGYDLIARSNSGKVTSPVNGDSQRSVRGSIAGGGPVVELATNSSRIFVE